MAGCLKPATTETKDETEHGDAADNGYSDRGSTPLASTTFALGRQPGVVAGGGCGRVEASGLFFPRNLLPIPSDVVNNTAN